MLVRFFYFFFFFQAEDGIRDSSVTGVQTCALPIYHVVVVGVRRALRPHGALLRRQRDRLCASDRQSQGEASEHLKQVPFALGDAARSEERRVGEEGRSRWAPYH